MPPASKPEPTEPEITGFALPGNVTTRMGDSAIILGNSMSNGMNMSGIVSRIVHLGSGTMRIYIGDKTMLMFSTGAMAEEK